MVHNTIESFKLDNTFPSTAHISCTQWIFVIWIQEEKNHNARIIEIMVQLYKWNLNELFWKYKIKKETIIETSDMISMKKIRIEPTPYFYFVLFIVFLFYFLLLCFSHLFCDEIMEDTQESNCLNSTRSLVPMDLSLFTVKWKNKIFVWSFLMF